MSAELKFVNLMLATVFQLSQSPDRDISRVATGELEVWSKRKKKLLSQSTAPETSTEDAHREVAMQG